MSEIRGEDWYGEQLGDVRHEKTKFVDVDFSEATTRGATFESCAFHNCRFNASRHENSAFIACDFRRTNFFDATFAGCKLLGSVFDECTMRPMKIQGGQWRGVTIRGSNLTRLDLRGEADLSDGRPRGAQLDGAALRGAQLDETTCVAPATDRVGQPGDRVDLSCRRLKKTSSTSHGAVLLTELAADVTSPRSVVREKWPSTRRREGHFSRTIPSGRRARRRSQTSPGA